MILDLFMTTKIEAERRRSFKIGMLTSDLSSTHQDLVGSAMFDRFKSFEKTNLHDELLSAISYSTRRFKNASTDYQGNGTITDNFSLVSFRYLPLSSNCDGTELIKAATKHQGQFDIFIIGEYIETCQLGDASELYGHKYELFCNAVDIIASLWNIPCLSWSCIPTTTKGSSHKQRENLSAYSHIKFFPDISPTIKTLFAVLRGMGWYQVGLLSFLEDEPWITFCNDVEEGILLNRNFTLQYYRTISSSPTATGIYGGFHADKIITHLHEFANSSSKGKTETSYTALFPYF